MGATVAFEQVVWDENSVSGRLVLALHQAPIKVIGPRGGSIIVMRYPGWMLGPAMAALENLKLTGSVGFKLHLNQGVLGSFDLQVEQGV